MDGENWRDFLCISRDNILSKYSNCKTLVSFTGFENCDILFIFKYLYVIVTLTTVFFIFNVCLFGELFSCREIIISLICEFNAKYYEFIVTKEIEISRNLAFRIRFGTKKFEFSLLTKQKNCGFLCSYND